MMEMCLRLGGLQNWSQTHRACLALSIDVSSLLCAKRKAQSEINLRVKKSHAAGLHPASRHYNLYNFIRRRRRTIQFGGDDAKSSCRQLQTI
jgi:hypothetical protein